MIDSAKKEPPEKTEPEPNFWGKLDILLKPTGGLLTAGVVAYLGYAGSNLLQQRQQSDAKLMQERQLAEAKVQLYAQIMSNREQSETGLRREMFNSIIQTFLGKDDKDLTPEVELDRQILAVELLTYNFHDAMDIGPLFKYLERKSNDIFANSNDTLTQKLDELKRTAGDVITKQIASLESDAEIMPRMFIFSDPVRGEPFIDVVLPQSNNTAETSGDSRRSPDTGAIQVNLEQYTYLTPKRFRVEVLDWDPKSEEVKVRLKVSDADTSNVEVDEVFWVGSFDFPLIDNTRLVGGGRCALVSDKFNYNYNPEPDIQDVRGASDTVVGQDRIYGDVRLTLIYFPGSRASLKSKPYYDEVLREAIGR